MDAKEHKRQSEEYLRERKKAREEMTQADQAVHGENSRVKYDPQTGGLREE